MATSNRIRALNRLPFDFQDGLKVGGVDVTALNQTFTPAGAGLVGFTPVGNLSAGNVQAALAELESEKVGFARLDDTDGSSLVGYDGGTVQDVMDSAKPMADYTALRVYTGRATSVRITSNGIAGFFYRDDADTSSADNGGTIIVSSNAKRWKRFYDGLVDAAWFGIVADWDGATGTDNTPRFQNAINYCISNNKNLFIPPSKKQYMINGVGSGLAPNTDGGLVVNGSLVLFMYGATLKINNTSSSSYVGINIRNAKDVAIVGGAIEGDRLNHIGTTGEQGHGLVITGSDRVYIRDVNIFNCWGDSIGIRTDGNPTNKNIVLDNVTSNAARRNGLTVQLVDGMQVLNCKFLNTSGTAPQAGVDVEPNPLEGTAKNITFQNCYFAGNASFDFTGGYGGGMENILISGCSFADVLATSISMSGQSVLSNVGIIGNTFRMRAGSGIGIAISNIANSVTVSENILIREGAFSSGASAGLYSDGTNNAVTFSRNKIKGFRSAIQVNSVNVNNLNIVDNDISECARGLLTNVAVSKLFLSGNTFKGMTEFGLQITLVDSTISNNLFEDMSPRAGVINATNCIFNGNTFRRVGTASQEPCISFTTTAENCAVVNNVFYSEIPEQQAIRATVAPTNPSFFAGNVARYGSYFTVYSLHAAHIVGENFASGTSSGSFTMAAGISKVVTSAYINNNCKVILTPTNSAAAALMSGSKSLYISAKTAGQSFTVGTSDGTAAAGTETFDYKITY